MKQSAEKAMNANHHAPASFLTSTARLLAIAAFAAVIAVPAAAQAPAAFTMAFVDMEKVVQEHPSTKARTDELQKELVSKIEELRATANAIRTKEENLDLLTEGSPDWLELLRQIRRDRAAVELDGKILRAEFQIKLVEAMKKIYEASKKVVAELAVERNLSAVAIYSSSPVGGRTRNELVTDIVTRPFIFHADALDITAEVISKLK